MFTTSLAQALSFGALTDFRAKVTSFDTVPN
jgi:hypothetical protein